MRVTAAIPILTAAGTRRDAVRSAVSYTHLMCIRDRSKWFMQEWLQITGASPHRTTVIYNPVDCNLFHPGQQAERNQNLILYALSLIHICSQAGDE